MTYITTTYKFLSEKPSLKVFTSDGQTVEFSPFYETKDEMIAEELRKLPHIFEVDVSQNSIEPLPDSVVLRNSEGRSKVADPVEDSDISTKNYVDMNISIKTAPLIHTHIKDEVGLPYVDNTADIDKPLSSKQKQYIDDAIYEVSSTGVVDATQYVKGKARISTSMEVEQVLNYTNSNDLSVDTIVTPSTLAIPVDELKSMITVSNTTLKTNIDDMSKELTSKVNTAQEAADNGVSLANIAQATADNGVNLANTAISNANTAQSTADGKLSSVNLNSDDTNGVLPIAKGGTGNTIGQASRLENVNVTDIATQSGGANNIGNSYMGVLAGVEDGYADNFPSISMHSTLLNVGYNGNAFMQLCTQNYQNRLFSRTFYGGEWRDNWKEYADVETVSSKAPLPQLAEGVGQWVTITGMWAVNVPDGGTWAYFLLAESQGNMSHISTGIVSGGTMVGYGSGSTGLYGFAWRIA